MRKTRIVAVTLAGLVAIVYVAFLRFPHPPEPRLSGFLTRSALYVGGRERSFAYYVPASLPPHAPLLLALHGSWEGGEAFRWHTGYAFDLLADSEQFVVVYPEAYEGHWDECRRVESSARTRHIDDVGFMRALIESFRTSHDVDPKRVFAVGYSNGGQMAYRLAMEAPGELRAVAAISANLGAPGNLDCVEGGKPISVLVMNGTKDPINPFLGGRATLFGFVDHGLVRSSEETARYFAGLGGDRVESRVERLPGGTPNLYVERSTWRGAGAEVVLDTIQGGGHVVPQAVTRYPRILGRTDATFDGPAEIWSFFARQRPR